MRFRALLMVPLLLVTLGGALVAQSPEDRRRLAQFRDSLDGTVDSVALLGLEQGLIALARSDRDNAMHHLRLGFIAVRLGDLGSQPRYEDGAGEFEWAAELQPTWPWAWYGLGIAEDRVGDSQIALVQGLQAMFGKDHLSRAANAYVRSVQADPSFVLGLVELASTALRQRINIKTDLARAALREAAATSAAANPEVLLYRGRVEREVGDIDSALAAFQGYLDRNGNRGLGLLELARTQLLDGQLTGQIAYYEGAALEDSSSVAGYRVDLALIASDSALKEFDVTRGQRRVAVLRRFWGQRDRAALLLDGERLREHYRRLYYAKRTFQLVSQNRHYDIVERYRSGSEEFDDRGMIYIRHGEPTQRASYVIPMVNDPQVTNDPRFSRVNNEGRLNESWRYVRDDGDLVFHFLAREDVQDYKLVESLFDILGYEVALELQADWAASPFNEVATQLVLSREQISPLYPRFITASTSGARRYMAEERDLGRRSLQIGTRTDSYEFSYPKRLYARTDLAIVGREADQSLLHVSYAIPGAVLEPIPSDRGVLYPVRLRLSVLDRDGRAVATVDSTRVFVAREPVPEGQFLVGLMRVAVVPGPLHYRLGLEQGTEHGVMMPVDTITAGDFSGADLEISSLVLGAREAHLSWRPTPSDTVWFNPVGSFYQNTAMELYYEVYGLRPAVSYRTEVTVTKEGGGRVLGLFGARRPSIRLAFSEDAEGIATQVRRSVALDRLSPGSYRIEVVVRDEAGSTRRSQARFEVRDRF